MAKLTTAEFIEAIKELSVMELNELVKACEEEFGVKMCIRDRSVSVCQAALQKLRKRR